MEKQRVVFLGAAELKGGKQGSLFLPERVLLENPDEGYAVLRKVASAYDYKPTRVTGGIYEGPAEFDGDSVSRLSKVLDFRGRIDHPAIPAFEAHTAALAHSARAAAAEKKAKAEPTIARHIEALAQLVAKANSLGGANAYAMTQAFAGMIQQRAGQIRMGR